MGIGLYTTDLAKNLVENSHSVTVLTTNPYYPWWKTPSDLEAYCSRESVIEGVRILRVNLNIPKQPKTIARISFEIQMWISMKRFAAKIDPQSTELIISVVPSLGSGLVGAQLSKKFGKKHFVIVQDLSSSGVKESGMSLGGFLERIVSRLDSRVIKSAVKVAVIAEPMKPIVSKWANSKTEVEYLPNYAVVDLNSNSDFNSNRKILSLAQDKKIVMYTGSIAKKQNLMNLYFAAEILKDQPAIQFIVFGHGNAEDELRKAARHLDNFSVLPAIPDSEYMSTLMAADLLVVNERSSQTTMALPSKIISYFASKTPVIAAIPAGGASFGILKDRAFIVEADNPIELAKKIEEALRLKGQGDKYASAAFKFYESYLTKESGRANYLRWIDK
jgi:glycosyltransferase involved in cell wall biosynthesis